MNQYDAIVIGAGHNGLTNGAYLAKAGLKVAVLERNPYIGGATVSRELHKGWWYSNCSYVSSLLRPEITRDLELPRHGLQVVSFGGGATFMRNGDYFGNYSDHDRHYREMARHSKRDANAYDRYAADTSLQTKLIRPYLMRTPPDPTSMKPRDLRDLLEFARSFMDLGEEKLLDTIKFWTASVGDYLNEYFETDVIKAHMAGSGIIGTALGVYSPGTAYVLLHHYMGDVDGNVGAWGFARGGMGAIANALSKAFQSYGGEIICDAEVKGMQWADGAWHVETKVGSFAAPIVVNAAGAWGDVIAARAGVHPMGLTPKRRTVILFDPPPDVDIEDWPLVIDADESWYFKPDAGKVLASPADETPVEPYDAQAEELDIALIADAIERMTSMTVGRISHSRAGLRTFTADKTPVVGFAPDAEGFFWLVGQGGYGIETSPAMGELTCALIIDGRAPDNFTKAGFSDQDVSPVRYH